MRHGMRATTPGWFRRFAACLRTHARRGSVDGEIVDDARGTHGFGYDPHFLVRALGRTTAELSPDEKNSISHRGQASREIARLLAARA